MKKTYRESFIKVFDADSPYGREVLSEHGEYVVIQMEVANPQTSMTTSRNMIVMAELITKKDYYNEIAKEAGNE